MTVNSNCCLSTPSSSLSVYTRIYFIYRQVMRKVATVPLIFGTPSPALRHNHTTAWPRSVSRESWESKHGGGRSETQRLPRASFADLLCFPGAKFRGFASDWKNSSQFWSGHQCQGWSEPDFEEKKPETYTCQKIQRWEVQFAGTVIIPQWSQFQNSFQQNGKWILA